MSEKQDPVKNEIIFSASGWKSYNEVENNNNEDSDDEDIVNENFKIKIYGRTEEGKSLTVTVDGFDPYFYVKIPDKWNKPQAITLINYVKGNLKYKNAGKGLKDFDIVKRNDAHGFNGDKLFKFIKLTFKNTKSFKSFENFFEYNKINNRILFPYPTKLKLYESNIEPFLRFMHIKNILPCGWIKITKFTKSTKVSYCDNDYRVNEKDIYCVDEQKQGKLVIMSFDIECIADDGHSFPQADNDKDYLTQIGSVFAYHGETEPFYKNIITLKKATKRSGMEDTDIQSYESETKVLLAWRDLMQRMNPDVITGWNINGFDFSYMHKRAKKLGIENAFSKLGKDFNESCKFEEKVLASSALGENILRYYDMTGRIIVDLMKVVQRDSKLDSYKLDFVSSNTIQEEIKMCDNHAEYSVIYSNGIYGIKEEDYVNIVYTMGFDTTTHNKKYKVLSLRQLTNEEIKEKYEKNKGIEGYDDYKFNIPKKLYKIKIDGQLPNELFVENNKNMWHILETKSFTRYICTDTRKDNDDDDSKSEGDVLSLIQQKTANSENPISGNIINWALAKDDMSPTDMFKFQKGTDKQRGTLAKYCVKDCELPLKLMEKLKVLNNNIGMANVCTVPLSYIFMRGQSIKVFSLVSKKCMEYGYLLPKIKKPYNPNPGPPDENAGYEGATVIEPQKGVHYEPIIVLDFAALYPRSMIYMNICMSRIVLDKQYENVKDYIYRTVVFKNNDGTTTTCKYAEHKSGEKGIYPKILQELLDQRAKKKKMMKTEPDEFLKNIYDALQLAYKLTANSLYGQLGAEVSPIFMKELAASTTSVGREMLEISKQFMEVNLRKLINYALHDEETYWDYCNELFKDSPPNKFIIKKTDPNDKTKLIVDTNNKKEFIEFFYKRTNEILSSEYAVRPKIIYGDTDSVFFSAKIHRLDDKIVMTNKQALRVSIEIGLLAGYAICAVLPEPEEQVYEKTIWPLILKQKKKYVGNLYEEDYTQYVLKCMGVELKRRDNALISKIAVSGIVNNILSGDGESVNLSINERNTNAVKFIKDFIKKVLRNQFPIEKFIISKTLKSTYKNREGQAHAVLADRIAKRDPGNAPNTNDRIPFVFIINKIKKLKKGEKLLQGDKVEDPSYIKEQGLEIDLLHYITNQIMKPCISYLELIAKNPQKIFIDYINKEINRRSGKQSIMNVLENGAIDFDDESDDEDDNKLKSDKINNIKKQSFIFKI
jgi:DNA polymerase elongation subunit (family B)